MLYVALALVGLNLATVLAGLRLVARDRREHARREDILIQRVCHLADRPLSTPGDGWAGPDKDDEPVLVANPEQWSWA